MSNFDVTGTLNFLNLGEGALKSLLDIIYPVGILVEFNNDTNPNDIMQGQVWQLWGKGKTTVCQDDGTFKLWVVLLERKATY